MAIYIPPNGLAGFAQQTPAVQSMGSRRTSSRRTKRRKSSASGGSSKRRRTKKKSAGARKPARLVKGSAAAKRYMASIRAKRRK